MAPDIVCSCLGGHFVCGPWRSERVVKGRGRGHPQMCPLSRCVICPRHLAGVPLARSCTSSPDLLFHGPCPPQSFPHGTVSGTCLMEVVTLHAVHFWQGWPFTQNRLPTKPEVPRGPCGQLVSDQKLPWPRGGPGPPTCSSLVFPVLSNLMVSCPHCPAAGRVRSHVVPHQSPGALVVPMAVSCRGLVLCLGPW